MDASAVTAAHLAFVVVGSRRARTISYEAARRKKNGKNMKDFFVVARHVRGVHM
jgi:hypothetical protein